MSAPHSLIGTQNGSSWVEGTAPIFNRDSTILTGLGMDWIRNSDPTIGFPLSIRSEARTRLLNKLGDGKAEWGQTLGEAKQTVDMISSLSGGMLDFLDDLAKSVKAPKKAVVGAMNKFRRTGLSSRQLQRVSEAWLTYKFGIVPLLGDIETSTEALNWLLFEENIPPRMIIKTGSSREEPFNGLVNGTNTNVAIAGYRTRVVGSVEQRCHLSCTYEIPVSSTRTLQQLGLGNPLSVAWELAPWSWAVDYVLGVGEWTNALFAREGTRFIEGSETLYMKITSDPSVYYELGPGWSWRKQPKPTTVNLTAGKIQRIVLTGSPSPWFPVFRNRLGLDQMANLCAALAMQGRPDRDSLMIPPAGWSGDWTD